MLTLGKFSFGMGDRFAHQAEAQLKACQLLARAGVEVVPVWNKSNREHVTVGSEPESVRLAADKAVAALGWKGPYHVDADHINLGTVDRFVPWSDFFTIDVASQIGRGGEREKTKRFVERHPELTRELAIPGIEQPFRARGEEIEAIAFKYLGAVEEAGKIYRHISEGKGEGKFITEVSMDETDAPQTPLELLVILVALADEQIPAQTIAPKFSGRFNKGVDYVGDVRQFEKEFEEDLAVIAHAVKTYGLPSNLKLSVHSGSDKFSIYPAMRRGLEKSGAGLHVKTAGTTWLEELIGLAEAGGGGLDLAKEIYAEALAHVDELCAPYAAVIDIEREKLKSAEEVRRWTGREFVGALRHEPGGHLCDQNLRQLLHVGYKIAAKKGKNYLDALERHKAEVSRNVTDNLFRRHLEPLFGKD